MTKEISLPPEYVERPCAPELDLVSRMHGRFKGTQFVMPQPQREIYENITKQFVEDVKKWRGFPKQIHKPSVVDVGCGVGIGANVMSLEAQFVWGIDSNEESINFANQMFARVPNNIYYTPQVTFDVINATDEPRELMQFDYVTSIEVIEHIPRPETDAYLQFLNRFVKKHKNGNWIEDDSRTKIYISTPNRNAPNIHKDTPRNEHHCWEATAEEMYTYLIQHYKYVTVLDSKLVPQELNTEATPLVYKLEIPLT